MIKILERYVCADCGNVVDEVPTERYVHNEIPGGYYEMIEEPCFCGGHFEEGRECANCGEYEAESVLIGGWCRACIAALCEEKGLDKNRDASEIYDIIEEGYEV